MRKEAQVGDMMWRRNEAQLIRLVSKDEEWMRL